MGILVRLLERRSSPENPKTSLSSINWPGDGYRTAAGANVSETTALTIAAVYRAIRLATEAISAIPLIVYTRLERGKERAVDHWLYRLLHDRPNPEMSSFTFWETIQGHIETWGNAYAEKEMRGDGTVAALWPLMPDRTHAERVGGKKRYKTRLPNGEGVILPDRLVMHIPGFGDNGISGKSPIGYARESLGLALATQEYGARHFGNGARASGVLVHPQQLSPAARKNIRESWNEMHQGLDKSHRVAILEEGVTWQSISIPPEDSQFLETRRFQVQEIARWFGIPLHMLMDNSTNPAANVEQAAIDWVMHGVRPRAVRIEKVVNWDVVPQGKLFAEFQLAALLRGDNASRATYYREMVQIGAMSPNDVRETDNLGNPIEGGDRYFVPLNWTPLDQAGQEPAESDPDDDDDDANPDARTRQLERLHRQLARGYARLFSDAVERSLNRELIAAKRARAKGPPEFRKWLAEFYPKHLEYLRQQFTPVLAAYGEAAGIDGDLDALVARVVTAFADRWVEASRAAFQVCLDAADPAGALDDTLAQWEANRATAIGDEFADVGQRVLGELLHLPLSPARSLPGLPAGPDLRGVVAEIGNVVRAALTAGPPAPAPVYHINIPSEIDIKRRPRRAVDLTRDATGTVIRMVETEVPE